MNEKYQSTFVLLKPNAIQRELVGEIISRFEHKGLRIDGIKMILIDNELAERHYGEHKGKDFYCELLEFITSGPSVAMVISGPDAIEAARYLVGDTNPLRAQVGTIRGEYAITTCKNIIHASADVSAAKREIPRFFKQSEVMNYHLDLEDDM